MSEWEPTTAELRDPSEVTETAHAQANLAEIREFVDAGVLDVDEYRSAIDRHERGEGA